MAKIDFAFSFLEDEDDSGIQTAIEGWIQWRHGADIANPEEVRVESLPAAHRIMAANLAKGDTVGDVYFYSHGDNDGLVHVRVDDALTSDPVGINSQRAGAYIKRFGDLLKPIRAATTVDSSLHLYGCHAGKSKDVLSVMRNLFFGKAGRSCGPDLFLNYLRFPIPRVKGTLFKSTKDCQSPNIDIKPADRAGVQAAVKAIDAKISDLTCLSARNKKKARGLLQKLTTAHFERFLLGLFRDFASAGLVPKRLMAKPSRTAILDEMWSLVSPEGEHIYPYLGQALIEVEAMIRGYPKSIQALKDDPGFYVTPGDPKWNSHWSSSPPRAPGAEGIPC